LGETEEIEGSAGNIVTTNADSWLSKFFGKVSDQLQDLTYVEILTLSATSSAEIGTSIDTTAPNVLKELETKGLKLLARTKIELDGDIIFAAPMMEGDKINKEVMDLHKENVTAAVENWNNFLKMILEVIRAFASLAGYKETEIFDKFVIDTRV
jgi:hypothetical protein